MNVFGCVAAYLPKCRFRKAGELGFEPRQADPESAVLPLHHSPKSTFKLGTRFGAVKIRQSVRGAGSVRREAGKSGHIGTTPAPAHGRSSQHKIESAKYVGTAWEGCPGVMP